MFGDNPHDQQLKESWGYFCDQLKEAGELVFRDTTPVHDLDRAKGFRLLARNISLALQFKLDNNDPNFPELLHYFDPLRKQGGDNTDALYIGSPINGEHTYRITGNRGDARYFAVTVLEDGDTPWGGQVVGNLIDEQMHVEEDGSFELILSPECHQGNWIKTTPGAWRVTFRQFFADWENEKPMDARIECLSHDKLKPETSVEQVQQGLRDSADWVRESTFYWADMIDKWKAQPNQFLSYRQLEDNAIDATPGGEPLICYWFLPKDEAIVVRVKPPEADYWAVEFGSYWWETMDYRRRLSNTNCHYADLQEDGELILVVSHEDPGVANWLDPAGHEEGYITVRWIGSETCPTPECEQISSSELQSRLPADISKLTPAERRAQLAERREGVLKRFGY